MSDRLKTILLILICTVFIDMLLLLFTLDFYARKAAMGKTDYFALMFGIIFLNMLGFIYYFIFSLVNQFLRKTEKKIHK
jgi:hypothetical protein